MVKRWEMRLFEFSRNLVMFSRIVKLPSVTIMSVGLCVCRTLRFFGVFQIEALNSVAFLRQMEDLGMAGLKILSSKRRPTPGSDTRFYGTPGP